MVTLQLLRKVKLIKNIRGNERAFFSLLIINLTNHLNQYEDNNLLQGVKCLISNIHFYPYLYSKHHFLTVSISSYILKLQ